MDTYVKRKTAFGHRHQNLRRFATGSDAIAVTAIVAVWILFFVSYLNGTQVPPWDFVGGYHTQTVAVFADGSLFSPPPYLPYGSFGFPTALALQSSVYYFPLGVIDAIGMTYDLVLAATVSAAHVLLGGIGAYVLLRVLRISSRAAAAPAVAYMLMSGFFSNQPNIDIVRAYAWFPLLLAVFIPRALLSRWGVVAAPIVVSSFLISAYPGAIASAGIVVVVVVLSSMLVSGDDRWRYLGRVSIVGVISLGVAQVKFVPFFALNDAIAPAPSGGRFGRLEPVQLVTIVAPPSRTLLPGDITMQGIFVAAVAGLLALFAGWRRRRIVLLSSVAVFGSLVLMWLPNDIRHLAGPLNISRFPIADWRMVLSLGITVLAAVGLDRVIAASPRVRSWVVRISLVVTALLLASVVAVSIGYPPKVIGVLFVIQIAGIVATGAVAVAAPRSWRGPAIAGVAVLAVASSGFAYHFAASDTWRGGDPEAWEQQVYGQTINEMLGAQRATSWEFRPQRISVGDGARADNGVRKTPEYRVAWYTQQFAALGHDNLKRVLPFTLMMQTAISDGTDVYWEFLTDRSRVLLHDSFPTMSFDEFAECAEGSPSFFAVDCRAEEDATVRMIEFSLDGSRYRVDTAKEFVLVENEPFYAGWVMTRCSVDGDCSPVESAQADVGNLRSWRIPPGEWTVETRYVPPGRSNAESIALAAFGMWLAVAVVALIGHRSGDVDDHQEIEAAGGESSDMAGVAE